MKAGELKIGDKFTWDGYPEYGIFTVTGYGKIFKGHVDATSEDFGSGLFSEEEVTLVTDMKYKVGDKLVVTENNSGHEWELGDVIVVEQVYPKDGDYYTSKEGTPYNWYVSDSEVAPYTEKLIPDTNVDSPTGGPSEYYDFPVAETLNDLIENRALNNWGAYGVHLFNIFKACWRWDTKEGTTKLYDAKKIVYSGLRLILMLEGKSEVAKYLSELSNDKQFKE